MHFEIPALTENTEQRIIAAIGACPAGTTSIGLSGKELHKLSIRALKRIFGALPADINALDLSNNILQEKSKKVFSLLPRRLISLNFTSNYIGSTSPSELTNDLFAGLPETLSSLNLKKNQLDNLGTQKIATILRSILPSVTSLDLSMNSLCRDSVVNLVEVLRNIPATVSSLNLSDDLYPLGRGSVDNIIAVIRAIPSTITTLDLTEHRLAQQSKEDLISIFSALPATLRSLDLSFNGLHVKSNAELDEIYAALPKEIQVKKDYNLNEILNSYLNKRASARDSAGQTIEYFYFGFFNFFQTSFSFTQKREAIEALQLALTGQYADLTPHIPTLENGTLGQALRQFIASGKTDSITNQPTRNIKTFIEALQLQLPTPPAQMVIGQEPQLMRATL